jgi:catechol 2,3-dioxygenase-like lactoylglutathione lyase family enzyme
MQTSGLNHIVLSVSDLDRSRRFYGDILGFDIHRLPADFPGIYAGSFFFAIGGVHIFFLAHGQLSPGDSFSEFRIGLDHLSFNAPSEDAMNALVNRLRAAGVKTTDVEIFEPSGAKYVMFRDPDNIQLEYWMD